MSIIAAATNERVVTDASGRRLGLRQLTALDKLRLFKAAGPELAQNDAWLGMAMLANSVTAIDDIPMPSATNELQIEAIVGRLGDVGISAVADALLSTIESDRTELVTNAGN